MRADPLILDPAPIGTVPPATPSARSIKAVLRDVYQLAKPNITFEVLLTTFTGMWLASGGPPDLMLTLWTLLGVGLASGSSCAFNNYIDREIDKHMVRTSKRPLPAGRLAPGVALVMGAVMGLLSIAVLLWQVNPLTAGLAVFTNFYYVVIYTLWLKRHSPLNTSLGGVSGALPAVLGVTAVANGLPPVAWALFGIMYIWQPPHFWALALIKVEEYRRVGIPMLPVVKGEAITKRQMLIYTVLLIPASMSLYWLNITGPIYLAAAALLGAVYLGLTIDFIRRPVERKIAYRLFFFSIIYLCILFVMMFVDHVPHLPV